ncbi:trypsin-like peptidase domain-containing protein [Caballeronia ptereochthonis]|uniref:Probable periplasmic serine endoprotease DegP-like n=1 Tax=Caballeronia ptereochthonis TaxID=1777144 RepID=A0A158AIM4_9BURK|nr:trypsin-like peptidase domain-containing protein [Caballeronia ptereochthonis]SAK57630.1 peptidase S1 and S6, chymotrypsin/Hap [Caballeronia ptereochthonis]
MFAIPAWRDGSSGRCVVLRQCLARLLLRVAVPIAMLAGIACLAFAAAPAGTLSATGEQPAPKAALAASAAETLDFPAIVERYGPAVVNVRAATPDDQPQTATPDILDADDPLLAFFKSVAPQFKEPASPPGVIFATGSGFIVSADGLILTTAHVVNQADEVSVTLTDRREFKAKVLSIDAASDVALLRIDAAGLPTVRLGDSSKVRPGEQVLTIGSPGRFQTTVTAGIVNATSPDMPDGKRFAFFQTDVATHPDNSGGPLFNRAGEVIGIDVQVYGGSERFQSLSFAIPINAAKARMQPEGPREVSKGRLGIEVQDVDPGLAGAFGLPRAAGALVISVAPGSPALDAGLKPGDVVEQVGDKPIDHAADFVERDAALAPGEKVALRIVRNAKPMTLTINPGVDAKSAHAPKSEASTADRLGLSVHPLTLAERRTSDLPQGLMVDAASGAAAKAGIQPGDIVLGVNDALVESQEELAALTSKAGKKAALLIQRDRARNFVSVDLK